MTRPLHSPSLTQTPLFGMFATERAAEAADASAVAARDGGRGAYAETSELAGPAIGAGVHALEAAVDARRPGAGRALGGGLGAAAGAALHFAGDDRVARTSLGHATASAAKTAVDATIGALFAIPDAIETGTSLAAAALPEGGARAAFALATEANPVRALRGGLYAAVDVTSVGAQAAHVALGGGDYADLDASVQTLEAAARDGDYGAIPRHLSALSDGLLQPTTGGGAGRMIYDNGRNNGGDDWWVE